MAKRKDSIVATVPTPLPVYYKKDFDNNLNGLLQLLKSIDFEQFREQNWIDLDTDTLLRIEDYIIELSKPEYKDYLEKMEIPSRPVKPKDCNTADFDTKLKSIEYDIRSRYYIKELIRIYSIYHDRNHVSRNYFLALCTHIKLTYCKQHPGEIIDLEGRFKSPKGLILNLARNVFLKDTSYFESHLDPETNQNIDVFHYDHLKDVFAFKLIAKKGFSPQSSRDKDTERLINERDALYNSLTDFDDFAEYLDKKPKEITNAQYIDYCISLIQSMIDNTIPKKEKSVITIYNEKINALLKMKKKLENRDLLNSSPLHEKLIEAINSNTIIDFKTYLNKYKKRIDAPLNLKGLESGINSILSNPNDETKQFQLTSSTIENKSTKSGHEGIHYDIITPYGTIELQLQTESQAYSDKYRDGTSHSLMPGKLLPDFTIPKCYTMEDYKKNKDDFEIAVDSKGKYYYYKKDDLNKYKRKWELYVGKKIRVYDSGSETESLTCELLSSLQNYSTTVLELPKNSKNPKIAQLREDYEWTCSELEGKSGSVQRLFFKYPTPRAYKFDSARIKKTIEECNFSSDGRVA